MEDIIPTVITFIDTVHRVIADSVTIEALTKSQEFYSTSFDKILVVLSTFVAIILATGFWNLWKSRKYKKELKDAQKKFSNLEKEFKEKLNKYEEELEKLKKNMKDTKSELQDVRNHSI